MINSLIVNGEELIGVYVDSSLSFNKPEKVVSTYAVPGRNGALIVDEGVWDNVMITYPCYIREMQGLTFRAQFRALVNKLAPLKGYQRIEQAWDPEHFRLGRVIVPTAPNPVRLNRDGFFDLSFDCKPQRFLTSGERTITYTASGKIKNPTVFNSKPLIRIHGNGSVTLGDTVITVSTNANNYTDIDCEMMDCFRGATNRNASVSFTGTDFPELVPGDNQVLLSGVTSVEITPRWWEL